MIELALGTTKSTHRALRHTKLLSAAAALLSCLACDGDSDDGIANYYLSGRVIDGATLEAVPNAEVVLSVGAAGTTDCLRRAASRAGLRVSARRVQARAHSCALGVARPAAGLGEECSGGRLRVPRTSCTAGVVGVIVS